MSHALKWSFEADLLHAHNGDCGCPCELGAPTAREFVSAWSIQEGNYGNIRLNSLCVALVAQWPGPIHQGGGTGGLLIDERANPSQAEALLNICLGRAGGLPFEWLGPTFARRLDPLLLPLQFKSNGRNSSVRAGSALNLAVEPIKNPLTGKPESLRLQYPTGTLFQEADCASTIGMEVNMGPLKFSRSHTAAFVAHVKYGN